MFFSRVLPARPQQLGEFLLRSSSCEDEIGLELPAGNQSLRRLNSGASLECAVDSVNLILAVAKNIHT
jgi:hypothetical protein